MMETAGERDGRRNDGKGNKDAHDRSLYWHCHSIGYARLTPISPR
jgi:hypothetical protein